MSFTSVDAGGVIYISKGEEFKSMGTNYTSNEAQSVGGVVMVESVKHVHIEFDNYINGKADTSGMPSTNRPRLIHMCSDLARWLHLWVQHCQLLYVGYVDEVLPGIEWRCLDSGRQFAL